MKVVMVMVMVLVEGIAMHAHNIIKNMSWLHSN